MAKSTGPYFFQSGGGSGESGGGAGGINYAENFFDGDSIANINTYNDGASATPTDGTGGTVTGLSTTLNTSTPLRGSSSQRFSKDANDRQGEGWSWDFTVDRADYEGSQPIYISFWYDVSADYASGDLRLFVYDVDNSTLLNVTSLTGDGSVNATDAPTLYTGVFYTNSTSNNYRLIWHITSTNASAWDFDWISLVVGPEALVPGAIVVDYGTESWTDNQANATTSVKLLRVGNRIFVDGKMTVTGALSGATTITIPTAYTANAGAYGSIGSGVFPTVGRVGFIDDTSFNSLGTLLLTSTTQLTIIVDTASSTYTSISNTSSTVPFTWASGDEITFTASWEVSDWQASAALSTTEAMLSSAVVIATKNSGSQGSSGSYEDVSWTESFDNLSAFDGTTFTAPKNMRVEINGIVTFAANSTGARQVAVTNSSGTVYFYSNELGGSSTISAGLLFTGTLNLAKGDTVKVRAFQNSGGSLNYATFGPGSYLSIKEVPDFSIFSVYGQSELIESASSGLTSYAITASQFGDLTSVSLTPGEWDIEGQASFNSNGVTTTGTIGLGIGTVSGNTTPGNEGDAIVFDQKDTASGSRNSLYVGRKGIVVTSTTTYYLKGYAGDSITNLQAGYKISARRVK